MGRYCQDCGTEVEEGASYCSSCGSSLSDGSEGEEDTQSDTPDEKPGRDEEYCRQCGEVVNAEPDVCPDCGMRKYPGEQGEETEKFVLSEIEQDRPVAGGSLLVFAGILLVYIPFRTLDNYAFTGGTAELIGLIGLVLGAIVFLSGAGAVTFPEMSNIFGMMGILMSFVSLIGGTFGGMGVGTFFGVLGGLLCVIWKPTDPEISIKKWVAVTLSIGGTPFVLALLYWWQTTELLAFWLALGVSAPFFIIGAVVSLLTYS